MFEGLQENQIKSAVEAMLFVTDEPLGVAKMAEMLQCDITLVDAALKELQEDFSSTERGIQLREVAGGWRLYTHPAFHELIETYVLSWDTRKLSAAATETLAVIAYSQPVTRASVASIRGVNSDSSINSLVEKGLVREMGTADLPGNPILYGTTRTFLEKFGLRSVKDLPDLAEYAPDDETRRLIMERLSATRNEVGVTEEQARLMAEDMMDGYGDEVEGVLIPEPTQEDAGLHPSTGVEDLEFARTDGPIAADDAMASFAAAAGDATLAALEESAAAELAAGLGSRKENTVIFEDGDDEEAQEARLAFDTAVDAAPIPQPGSSQEMFARAIASTLGVVDKIDFDALHFDTDDE